MKSSLSFLVIAFVLASAASFLNFVWYKSNVPKTVNFAVLNKSVKKGDTITKEMFSTLSIMKPSEKEEENTKIVSAFEKSYLRMADISIIDKTKAMQNYQAGELMPRQSAGLTEPMQDYSLLGPFRLISVGSQIVTGAEDQADHAKNRGENAVTVAIKISDKKLDPNTTRLMQIIEKQQQRQSSSPDLRIVGVVADVDPSTTKVAPDASNEKVKPTFQLEEGEFALFVPLPNVETVPAILLTGNEPKIYFVVPTLALPPQNLQLQAPDQTEK